MNPKPSNPANREDQTIESLGEIIDAGFLNPALDRTLLTKPVSRWTKDNWKTAAQMLANTKPATGIIAKRMHQNYIEQIRDRVNHPTTNETVRRKRGRPIKWENPQELLDLVEARKVELAHDKEIPIEKVTDKMAAESGAQQAWNDHKRIERTKSQQIERFQLIIKTLRKLVKLRE
jgi:hypothetical protein